MEKRFIGRGDKYGRLERDEAQIDADGHEPAELAAASGAHPRAFAEFENVTRPFVEANQALGLKSAKLMRSGERKSVVDWLLFNADSAGPHDGVDYQPLYRADHSGG
jgi:hypothetical protein